ncbi:MAG: ComEC/Rec2 family competence protein [Candidatus Krumholzibacteriota bacterium]|nr:ComEC/Rec2 family competence protein [Candidatus Krumholzibacteriota bacterium]
MTTMWWTVFLCLGLLRPQGGGAVLAGILAFIVAAGWCLRFAGTARAGGRPGTDVARRRWRRAATTAAAGIVLMGAGASIRGEVEEGSAGQHVAIVDRIAARARARCDRGVLSPTARAFIRALLLADRGALPPETIERYRYLGLSHLLALSGLHLGVVLIGVGAAFAASGISRRSREAATASAALIYAAAARFPPSLVRALLLGGVAILRRSAGLAPSLENSLWLCVLAAAVVVPRSLATLSFALSASAVAAIAFLAIPAMNRFGGRRGGARGVARAIVCALTLSASILAGTLPVIALIFGRVPLVSPLATLVAMIPVTLYLYVGMAYILFPSSCLPALAALAEPLAFLLEKLPAAMCRLPCPAIYRGTFALPAYVAGLGLLCVSLGSPGRRGRLSTAAALLAVSFLCGGGDAVRGPSVERIDGRACLVEDGERILIVETVFRANDAQRIVSGLWRRGVGAVDLLVVLQGDGRGAAAAGRIASRLGVGRIVLSPYALVGAESDRWRATVIADGRAATIVVGDLEALIGAVPFPPRPGCPVGEARARLTLSVRSVGEGRIVYPAERER